MGETFVPPFFAGLSVGVYCFAWCIPFIAPIVVSEERARRENVLVVIKFIVGRFIGYAAFGAAVGFLGEKINNEVLNLILVASLAVLSIVLILHAVGLIGSGRFHFCAAIKNSNPKFPLAMGFLMGINICPPFLMSLTYVFTLHSLLKGVTYFILFFLGTSVYFIPLFFLGFLNRMKEFQFIGRLSAVIVGMVFLVYSIYNIMRGMPMFHLG